MKTNFDELDAFANALAEAAKTDRTTDDISDILSSGFMQKYTHYENLNDFCKNASFSAEDLNFINTFPEDEIDDYVNDNTQFPNWDTMIDAALKHYPNIDL